MGTGVRKYVKAILNLLTAVALLLLAVLLLPWLLRFFMPFVIGWLISVLLSIALLVFMILGIVNAAQGKAKELPLIGSIKIIQ